MKFRFGKGTFVSVLSVITLMCLLISSGCLNRAKSDLVSRSDTAVSETDLTSHSDLARSDAANAVITTASTTVSTSKPTGKTTWNDEDPSVPYSRTKYKIVVYIGSQSTVVYSPDKQGEYTKIVKCFSCSTGASETPTRTGTYRARAKYRWRFMDGVYGQYCTSISRNYLFHSAPYRKKDVSTLKGEEYDKLGSPASHGCIRMCVRDCKWLYDNIPLGTEVQIVKDSGPAGPGVPLRNTASTYDGWEPTDEWAQGSPYFNNVVS